MSKPNPPTRAQFDKRFPDDAACLEHLKIVRYGARLACESCKREATFYRVSTRRAYSCEHCGFQIYPTAGTPFHASRTSLKDWFFVMFLFCASRNGVAAKEVQRQIGVTYKTAWRMCHMIRQYMGFVDGDFPVGGGGSFGVEVDETFIGGRDPKGTKDDKHIVWGAVERGGSIITRPLDDRRSRSIHFAMEHSIRPGTLVFTDEATMYQPGSRLHKLYDISSVNHSIKEWVRGDAHTNTIESFWNLLKRGVNGTYIAISQRHLSKYLCEFEYRWNFRHAQHLMLDALLASFPKPQPKAR